jgi:hypothetical protein
MHEFPTAALVRDEDNGDPVQAVVLDHANAVNFIQTLALFSEKDADEYQVVDTPEALAAFYQDLAEFDEYVSEYGPGVGVYIHQFYVAARGEVASGA